MKVIKFILYYILGAAGIFFISLAPSLFRGGSFLNLKVFFHEGRMLIESMADPSQWVYQTLRETKPLIPYLWELYLYSMTIFAGAMIIAVVTALLLAFGVLFLPDRIKFPFKRIIDLLEAFPDLLLAFCLQFFIVWFFEKTDILLIDFLTLRDDKIYLLPIITLAVLPAVTLYKILLLQMEEEMAKSYVSLAKSKGLTKSFILMRHVLRNILKSTFYQSKVVIWSSLSSLMIIEYIFNINAITNALVSDFRPIVTMVILLMLFTPFFIIYQGVELFIFKEQKITEETDLKMNSFIGRFQKRTRHNDWWKQIVQGTVVLFKNPKFLAGFSVIFLITMTSLIYTLTADPLVDKIYHIENDEGKLVSAAPHSPEYVFLGTDILGFSIFDQLLTGAKYTVLFALVIAFLRVALGFILSIPYTFFLPEGWQRVISKVVDGIHFLPITAIAYLLLLPVLMMPVDGFTTTETERIVYQGLILTVLAVPLLVILFRNEMKLMMREEFVLSTKVLGGSSVHLIWRHLLPHLKARIVIIFGQQFIQTLLIFIHLGVFEIYFGGTKLSFDPLRPDPPQSTTYEWSGLIGGSREALMTGHWWYIIPPLAAFMILIISMQGIIQGIKEVQLRRAGVPVKQKKERISFQKKNLHESSSQVYDITKAEKFVFISEAAKKRIKQTFD
ncbi:ABC transporter permease subunit [Halobacillus massiliensis]|uniref:ABC transporter permease subunit n=1 Tax=Halobacillus massiliensis TaxID=1926286 RepID=UPI0009E3C41A|nr:ABC transporter permease subunit [Halobacillus massiliensis]